MEEHCFPMGVAQVRQCYFSRSQTAASGSSWGKMSGTAGECRSKMCVRVQLERSVCRRECSLRSNRRKRIVVTLSISVTHGGGEKPKGLACCETDCRPVHVSVSDQERRSDDSMARRKAYRRLTVLRTRHLGCGRCGEGPGCVVDPERRAQHLYRGAPPPGLVEPRAGCPYLGRKEHLSPPL